MLGVLANDHQSPFATDDLAVLAHLPHRTSDFHRNILSVNQTLSFTVRDPALFWVILGEFDQHVVAGQDANIIFANPSRDMTQRDRPVFELYPKERVRVRFQHFSALFDELALRNRAPPPLLARPGEPLRSVFCDEDHLFDVHGEPAVGHACRPAVVGYFDLGRVFLDHRLDR